MEGLQCQLNSKSPILLMLHKNLYLRHSPIHNIYRTGGGQKDGRFMLLKQISDFRSGGVFHYSQKPADGDIMWVRFLYSEIVAPEKIIYTSFFSDEEGNIVRAPFDANWPLKTLNSMTFIEGERLWLPNPRQRKSSKPSRLHKRSFRKGLPEPSINYPNT